MGPPLAQKLPFSIHAPPLPSEYNRLVYSFENLPFFLQKKKIDLSQLHLYIIPACMSSYISV